jgi:hypothetical protein
MKKVSLILFMIASVYFIKASIEFVQFFNAPELQSVDSANQISTTAIFSGWIFLASFFVRNAK